MRLPTLAAALLLGLALAGPLAAEAPATPALNPLQQEALHCSAVFALGAEMQARSDPAAHGWPPLALRGREYFVRVAAQLIDETGMTRTMVAKLMGDAARDLSGPGAVAAAMPPCLIQLAASGL